MAYQGLYISDTTGNGNPFGLSAVRLPSADTSSGTSRHAASAASGAAKQKTPVYDVYERTPESLRGVAGNQETTAAAQAADATEAALKGTEKDDAAGKTELNPGESDEKKPGRRSSPAECETCKERKYKDGSDEMVSYKTATHISPSEAPSRVMAHEGEHVANAYKKAEQNDGKVLSVSVSIHTAVCPECGRVYVSGGETRTRIAYRQNSGDDSQDNGREVLGARLDKTA